MKLTRKTIEEGLRSVPIDTVLLGASKERNRLTAKQRKFAEAIAIGGKSKAAAYREAYDTKANHKVHSVEGQRLTANPAVAMQINALIVAEEARKHATPAALRALVIERLTRHALDDDIPPAQRLRALELLGKVTEVAAFTERREVVTHTDAGSARARLLEVLRSAVQSTATDVGATLLEEIAAPRQDATSPGDEPTTPPPARERVGPPAATLHSIPHSQSPNFEEPPPSLTTGPSEPPPPISGEDPPLESQTSSGGDVLG